MSNKYSATEGQNYKCNCCQVSAVVCLPAQIYSTTGRLIGEAQAGKDFKVPDSVVSNSNDSYVYKLPATVDLELPDINHIDADGTVVPTPAQTPFLCTPCEIDPETVVELFNTVPDLISTNTIPSGVPAQITAPDSSVTINSTAFFDVPSNDTENIDIVDSNDNLIPIVNQTADTVEVDVLALNAIYEIYNSTPTLIENGVIASGATKTITLDDTNWVVQVDGVDVDMGTMATLEDNTLIINL